jgi:flavodoxin
MKLVFVYASTSGNVEATMGYIANKLSKVGYETELVRVEKVDFSVFEKNEIFVLGTSTWDHGTINPFWDKMLEEIKTKRVEGKKACFVGLGDVRYEPVYFCKGIDTLRDIFLQAGGVQIGVTLKINGDPYVMFNQEKSLINIWTDNLIAQLKNV